MGRGGQHAGSEAPSSENANGATTGGSTARVTTAGGEASSSENVNGATIGGSATVATATTTVTTEGRRSKGHKRGAEDELEDTAPVQQRRRTTPRGVATGRGMANAGGTSSNNRFAGLTIDSDTEMVDVDTQESVPLDGGREGGEGAEPTTEGEARASIEKHLGARTSL